MVDNMRVRINIRNPHKMITLRKEIINGEQLSTMNNIKMINGD